jgi:predicted ATP-dependent endonuclease of OLD family
MVVITVLKRVKLVNFKGFKDYVLHFREENVLVGKNNAGKSTIVDALRIVSLTVKKSTRGVYDLLPKELNLPGETYGLRLKLDELKIDQQTITYWYEDQPAEIIADFENKVRIHVYLGSVDKLKYR